MTKEKEPKIVLHPEKGVNPKIVRCNQCGKDTECIVMLGKRDFVEKCPQCDTMLIGGGPCPACGVKGVERRPLDEVSQQMGWTNTIPGGLCDACEEKNKACDEMVKAGGVVWRCVDCGSAGAIRGGHPLAEEVRKRMGVEAPKPCGIEFSKENACPVCSEDAVVDDADDADNADE